MSSSRSRDDFSSSRDSMSGGSSPSGSSRVSSDRIRNRSESDSEMGESGEDLQRKQREGDLGSERIRGTGE